MTYRAPLADFRFLLDHVLGFAELAAQPRFADATPETVDAILTEAGRLCESLAPLNRAGDKNPARLENGVVRCSPGFAQGFRAIADGGWTAPQNNECSFAPAKLRTAITNFWRRGTVALPRNTS